ncbi:hypothetical protein NSO95_05285 [Qipengyuania sp. RS5-5]|uniref:Uncharacterized protein n=2 Tax=Parerythrobacter lacustris TaxID=2969984 RepID=A0ABT1XNW5_9SPHN|nr:hypothetical protein [Parerythrobacter lacustris]
MADARDDWWLIGSAAVALHGADPGTIADVDVVLSEADARHIFTLQGIPSAPGIADERFVSKIFATWSDAPLRVEFMAGLHRSEGGVWQPVRPRTRVAVERDGWRVFVPARTELAEILRSFGRPKDQLRLAALEAL